MASNNIQEIFTFLRGTETPIIIGLTGALGAGCSTVAEVLKDNFLRKFQNIDVNIFTEQQKKIYFDKLEYYRFRRIKDFFSSYPYKGKGIDIQVIKVSDILERLKRNEKNFLKEILDRNINISKIISIINKCNSFQEWNRESERKKELQKFGRCLRKIKLFKNIPPVFNIAYIVDRFISTQMKKSNRIKIFVIDALRNPFEIEYFRNKYNQFYLFSILAEKSTREKRLKRLGFSPDEIKEVQIIETKEPKSEEELYEQNINFCIVKGDIFINNNYDNALDLLKYQLGKYLALILKPGLVTPTKDEMYMQLAFSARNMSGCISRQVGAVVIGEDGYIRGVGWNNPPEKFIPCLYRTLEDLRNNPNDSLFSEFEKSIEFIKAAEEFKKRENYLDNQPFCFKDIENNRRFNENIKKIEKEIKNSKVSKNIKRQILNIIKKHIKYRDPSRERALHAEENAFLQASKVGGAPLINGTLYSTAFPCQLCAKKSRQLFISRIVYIEDYPDISYSHTLRGGAKETQPKVEMFTGAIGQAYYKLYNPYIPIKDEIKLSKNVGRKNKKRYKKRRLKQLNKSKQ